MQRTSITPVRLAAFMLAASSLVSCSTGEAPNETNDNGDDAGVDATVGPELAAQHLCGDGVRAGSEECDDGNQLLGDGCTPSCKSTPLGCGDRELQAGEECDDGNLYNHDTCSDSCTVNRCGNMRQDALEECDDGNVNNEDGCSNACSENRCRNGRVDPGEECDDGNEINDDGTWLYTDGTRNHRDTCSNTCKVLECGNGRIEGPLYNGSEECDDGNEQPLDGCSNACKGTGCGNEVVEPGEICESNEARKRCVSCTAYVDDTACAQCREQNCRDYEALNPYDLCFEPQKLASTDGNIPNPLFGLPATDERVVAFVSTCESLVTCMRAKSAEAYSITGPILSFCGQADPSTTCFSDINAIDGPCKSQWFLAAGFTPGHEILNDFFGRAIDPLFPAGAANWIVRCDAELCLDECGPR